jgi:hypothetical protein
MKNFGCGKNSFFVAISGKSFEIVNDQTRNKSTDTLTRMRAQIDVVEAEGFSAPGRKIGRSKALLSKYVREIKGFIDEVDGEE